MDIDDIELSNDFSDSEPNFSEEESIDINNDRKLNLNNPTDKIFLIKLLQKSNNKTSEKNEVLLKLEQQEKKMKKLSNKLIKIQTEKNPQRKIKYLKEKIEKLEDFIFEKPRRKNKIEEMIELFAYNLKQKLMTLPFRRKLKEKKKYKKKKNKKKN